MMLTFDTLALALILTAVVGETVRLAIWLRRAKNAAGGALADPEPTPDAPAAEA